MSYPRNAASPPPVLVGQVVQNSDGALQTSGASVRVRIGTGSWGAGAGTLACDATSGFWDYLPTQAETNAESFEVAIYKASCTGSGLTVVTSANSTAGVPADSSGTTTLLSRLSSARAGYLDNINNPNLASVPAFPANFAALGINASGHISRVVLCDTISTYSGNTPQTGDAYAIVNSGTYGNAAIKSALDIAAGQVTLVYTSIYAGQGTVAASPSPATTSFASGRTEASGFWDDAKITFTSGALSGQTRIVSSYSNTNGVFTFDEAMTSAPSSGDTFSILRGHDHTKSQIASAVRTELATELLVVTRLGTGIELDGSVYRFTANALELAPSSSGGDATAANQTTIINHLTAIKGGGFSGSSDSLEAISDAVAGLAVSSGSGAYTITITVNDGTTALQGAIVRVTEGATTIAGTTNASGVVVFALDAAAWSLAITKPGYSYTPTTLTVSATASFTRSMTAVSIDPPAGPGLSTGTIICYGTDGLAESGARVYVRLTSGPGTAGAALDIAELTLTANGSGVASHTGFVRGATYKARRGTSGTWVSFVVPDADSFDIAELEGSP